MAAVQMEREVIQLPPTAKHADTCDWFVRSYMALTSVSVFEHIFVVMICLNSWPPPSFSHGVEFHIYISFLEGLFISFIHRLVFLLLSAFFIGRIPLYSAS